MSIQYNLTANAGQYTEPVSIISNTKVTATNGYIEWAPNSLEDYKNNVVVWQTWPVGADGGSAISLNEMIVRLVGVSAGASAVIDQGNNTSVTFGPTPLNAYWLVGASMYGIDGGVLAAGLNEAQTANGATGVVGNNTEGDPILTDGSVAEYARISSIYKDYVCCLPLNGNAKDISGKGNDAFQRPAFLDATAWANAGYMTTTSAANQFAMLSNANTSVDLTEEHFLLSVVINAAVPASEVSSFIGFGNGTQKGLQVNLMPTGANAGKLKIQFFFDDGTTGILGITNGVFVDSTDHTLGIAVDRFTGHVYVFLDGVADTYAYGLCKNKTMTTNAGYRAGIGGSVTNTDTGFDGKDGKFKGWHLMTPKRFPLNLIQVMRTLHAYPTTPLTDSQVIKRPENSTVLVAPFGQSMFAGSGEAGASVRYLGSPQSDLMVGGVAPNGTINKRSFWPRLIESSGRAGWWMHVYNMAQGGTSAVDTWVGRIRTWQSGQGVVRGSYFKSSDGGLWRSNIASGTPAITTTTEPTGTSNVTLNSIPWIYLRPSTGADVDGVVSVTSPLFDPLGLCARLLVPLAWGFDKVVVPIEFGQTDSGSTMNVTLQQYKDAHKAMAQYSLNNGVDNVFLGLSSYAGASADNAYLNIFTPALQAAVDEMADPRVKLGVNLRLALGVLATPPLGVIGLQSDATHLNNPGYDGGSDLQYSLWSDNGVFS